MNRRLIGYGTLAAGIGALLCLVPASMSAQGPEAQTLADAQAAATPRDAQGHPNLNSVYVAPAAVPVRNGSGVGESGDIVNLLTGRSSTGGVLGQAAVNFEQDNTLIRRM